MNIENLTLKQIREIQSLTFENSEKKSKIDSILVGKKVLVRTYSVGVHFGTLVEKEGSEILLENSHRLWSWRGAFTLSEVVTKGVSDGTRVSCAVPMIVIEANEIIPISDTYFNKLLSYVEQ